MTGLLELGAEVDWTDPDAARSARAHARPGSGRLGELVEWLSATQGRFPPGVPARPRCVVLGGLDERVGALAASLDVGVRTVDVPESPADALAAALDVADDEVDSGADLVVLAARDPMPAPAVIVGLYTGAEPVALLPRGAEAVDTAAWVSRAGYLRDARRRVTGLRGRPEEMIAALDSPVLAAATALVLRLVARRTPLVLDGPTAVAAAVLCYEIQPRAGRWWQVADTGADPILARAAEHLARPPLLDLRAAAGDGTAGLLAAAVLRVAALTAADAA